MTLGTLIVINLIFLIHKIWTALGYLGGSVVEHLHLAQAKVLGSLIGLPMGSLLLLLPMSLPLSFSVSYQSINQSILKKENLKMGTWVAQLVKHLTLDFSLDHDLRVVKLNPALGSALGVGHA